jgi:uncharacterized protein
MATASELSQQELDAYRVAARRRHETERQALAAREERAWLLARQAADLLREHFQVSRVVVFGSLAHSDRFTPWSDVDIAAWGLRPDNWLKAIGMVMDLDNAIPLNLVDMGVCKTSIMQVIEREGVPV